MNENKFHRLIEKCLTSEEELQKEKVLEKIYSEVEYNKPKKKSKMMFKLIPVATAFVLLCVIITPIFINTKGNNLIEGSIANSTNQSNSIIEESSSNSQVSIHEENVEIIVPKDCFEGRLSVVGDEKFFDSIDGLYHKEILANVIIEDYYSGAQINFEEISAKDRIFAVIVTEDNVYKYSNYQVGDLVKLRVK